jgi:hypothetical protein
MPFLRGDPGMIEEVLAEMDPADLPDGFGDSLDEFKYEEAKATFRPKKLEKVSQVTLDALLGMEATHLRVRYDGGYDEGFAYTDHVQIGKTKRKSDDVIKSLVKAGCGGKIRKVERKLLQDYYGKKLSDAMAAEHGLDTLAHELASLLLGEGYGTGEYELYGAFTVDLMSGKIVDDPKAKKGKKKR